MSKSIKLVQLYAEMAELTRAKCGTEQSCRVWNQSKRCCDKMYCDMAIQIAKEDWNVDLTPAEDPVENHSGTITFLSKTKGCVVAPHFRPICTLHVCSINSVGIDKDTSFTNQYFDLREQIDEIELNEFKAEQRTVGKYA
jgi:hypothetical protein